ncbi:MAG: FAD-dependent monooxygenase [Anaerolineales bacterium]
MTEQNLDRVLIIGAGPIGMIAGLELSRYGVPVTILDDDDKFADGSRAIAMHSSLLEVFERNQCLQPNLDKGVVWNSLPLSTCSKAIPKNIYTTASAKNH